MPKIFAIIIISGLSGALSSWFFIWLFDWSYLMGIPFVIISVLFGLLIANEKSKEEQFAEDLDQIESLKKHKL